MLNSEVWRALRERPAKLGTVQDKFFYSWRNIRGHKSDQNY